MVYGLGYGRLAGLGARFVLTLIAVSLCSAQERRAPKLALDTSRPYVHVTFECAGAREPYRTHESERGAWLRLI